MDCGLSIHTVKSATPNAKSKVRNQESAIPMIPSRLTFITLATLLAFVLAPAALDAKRKKPPPKHTLKIVDITTSPVPFAPGHGPMALTVTVELPENTDEFDVLEVSSLISVPTRRSIRFLVSRQPLNAVISEDGRPHVKTTLLWDGKDQTRQHVRQGTYSYEARAKLMAHEDGFIKARIVSPFARGTLDVSSPQALAKQPPHEEHVPFISDEAGSDLLQEEAEDSKGADQAANDGDAAPSFPRKHALDSDRGRESRIGIADQAANDGDAEEVEQRDRE